MHIIQTESCNNIITKFPGYNLTHKLYLSHEIIINKFGVFGVNYHQCILGQIFISIKQNTGIILGDSVCSKLLVCQSVTQLYWLFLINLGWFMPSIITKDIKYRSWLEGLEDGRWVEDMCVGDTWRSERELTRKYKIIHKYLPQSISTSIFSLYLCAKPHSSLLCSLSLPLSICGCSRSGIVLADASTR